MNRLLIAAGLGLALFVTTAGSSLGIVIIGGMPEQVCEAPAAEASRDRVRREPGGITDPENCTFYIIDGSEPRP
jgi:hypothetical protein